MDELYKLWGFYLNRAYMFREGSKMRQKWLDKTCEVERILVAKNQN